jgi:hypothetical protein
MSSHLDGLNVKQWELLLQTTTITKVGYICSLEAYIDTDIKVFPVGIIVLDEKREYELEINGWFEMKERLLPIKEYFKKRFAKWRIVCTL